MSTSGATYSLVIQEVMKRYAPRDLPERAELMTLQLQSIVVVEIRSERRNETPTTFQQRLKVVGSYISGSQAGYYGQLTSDAPDGLVLALRNIPYQPVGTLEFRSDHVLRIDQSPPHPSDENVIELEPIYEVKTIKSAGCPALMDAVQLFYDNKLVGLIEA